MSSGNNGASDVKNIWGPGPIGRTAFFRKAFTPGVPVEKAILRIFVDTGYELYLNERFVAHVDEWNNMRDYDVTPWLVPGANLIAVKGLNHGGHRGFALELRTFLADGAASSVVSGGDWKASSGERWGWKSASHDDSQWECARVLDLSQSGDRQWKDRPGDDPSKVIPFISNSLFFQSETPKCASSPFYNRSQPESVVPEPVLAVIGEEYRQSQREYPQAVIAASRVAESDAGNGSLENVAGLLDDSTGGMRVTAKAASGGPVVVADFGGETIGYLRFKLTSEKAVTVKLTYGETLHECHFPPTVDMLLHRMIVEEVRFDAGVQEWESRVRQGFRFVRIELSNGAAPVTLEGLSVKTSIYATTYAGYFSCSDEALNKLWTAGRKTLHLCMQEYYLDGIKRDRFLWVADARLEALINYFTFGDVDLFRYSWRRLAVCQYQDGAIPAVLGEGAPVLWDYVAWWIVAFEDYYLHTGDLEFVRELKRSLVRAMDWLIGKSGEDGLVDVPANRTESWMCILSNKSGKDLAFNQLYYRALGTVAHLLESLGEGVAGERYRRLSEQTRKSFNALPGSPGIDSVIPEFGYFASASVDGFEIAENHFHHGRPDEALEFIRENWMGALDAGTDTLWEAPCKKAPYRVDEVGSEFTSISRCHGWTAGPTYALLSGVVGIRPTVPGFAEFEVRPQFGKLTFAKGVVPTPRGLLAVSITRKGEAYSGQILIPEGCRARLVLPNDSVKGLQFSLNGKTVEEGSCLRRVSDADGIGFEIDGAGICVFSANQAA